MSRNHAEGANRRPTGCRGRVDEFGDAAQDSAGETARDKGGEKSSGKLLRGDSRGMAARR